MHEPKLTLSNTKGKIIVVLKRAFLMMAAVAILHGWTPPSVQKRRRVDATILLYDAFVDFVTSLNVDSPEHSTYVMTKKDAKRFGIALLNASDFIQSNTVMMWEEPTLEEDKEGNSLDPASLSDNNDPGCQGEFVLHCISHGHLQDNMHNDDRNYTWLEYHFACDRGIHLLREIAAMAQRGELTITADPQ